MLDKILNLETMGNHIINLVVYGGLNHDTANELHYRSFCYFKEQEQRRSKQAHANLREISIPLITDKQNNTRTGKTDKE